MVESERRPTSLRGKRYLSAQVFHRKIHVAEGKLAVLVHEGIAQFIYGTSQVIACSRSRVALIMLSLFWSERRVKSRHGKEAIRSKKCFGLKFLDHADERPSRVNCKAHLTLLSLGSGGHAIIKLNSIVISRTGTEVAIIILSPGMNRDM